MIWKSRNHTVFRNQTWSIEESIARIQRMELFACNLGRSSVLQAGLWAIFHGIQLARERVLFKLEFQSDSREVIDLVNEGWDDSNEAFPMVRAIKEAIQPYLQVIFKHILREGNLTAGAMAKFGLSMGQSLFFVDPPDFVLPMLCADKTAFSVPV